MGREKSIPGPASTAVAGAPVLKPGAGILLKEGLIRGRIMEGCPGMPGSMHRVDILDQVCGSVE